jgi:hypothetical protein
VRAVNDHLGRRSNPRDVALADRQALTVDAHDNTMMGYVYTSMYTRLYIYIYIYIYNVDKVCVLPEDVGVKLEHFEPVFRGIFGFVCAVCAACAVCAVCVVLATQRINGGGKIKVKSSRTEVARRVETS